MDLIRNYLCNVSNDYYNVLTSNCSTFASTIWNLVSSNKVSADFINTPENLKNSIKSYSYNEKQYIAYNSHSGYYNGESFVYSNGL